MRLKRLFVAAFTLLSVSAAALAQSHQMPPIPVDTAVHTGKLANGLTYYVRHNNYPENRVNFYIAQRVGSIQEEESQRGLAHFLEHMAFNGSDHFKGNGIIDYTRSLGVEFGKDLNAYTSVDRTVYNINDVPSNRRSSLDSCLLVLRDWSCGLTLDGKEIDKERGVIHEEWRLRSSASQRMLERNLETLYPGSKYGKRMPIGLMSVVDNFKYKELRDYYKKWYHPSNQAIIVVGDVDVDYTINKIKEMFSDIPNPANAAPVVDEPVPDNAQPIVVVDKDKEQQYNQVVLYFKHDPVPDNEKGNIGYMLDGYVKYAVSSMLNDRLREKAQDPACPYLQAFAYDGQYIFSKTKDAFNLIGVAKPGMENATLKAVYEEAERAIQHGFTATEYARMQSEYLSQLEKKYNNRNKISNDSYASDYTENYLQNEPMASVETEYTLMKQIVPHISVNVINKALPELISKSDSNVVVQAFCTEKPGATYPSADQLKSTLAQVRAEKLDAYVDNVKNEPLISKLPAKGKIVKEVADKKFDTKVLTLSNGVKVVLKHTDFKADEVRMMAEAKGGSSLYGPKDFTNLNVFDDAVGSSGLGDFSFEELQKALAGKQVGVNYSLSTSYARLSGNSTVKDLETMMQLTYLNFTAINKDEKNWASTMNLYKTYFENKDNKPEAVFRDSVNYIINNHSLREKPMKLEDLKNVNYDRILQIAKERTANAANFTFYFVGNFEEDSIKPLIEQYIASLPSLGKANETYKNVAERPTGKHVVEFTRKMETPKAMAQMYWYNTSMPYSLENSIYADAAGQLLSIVYLQKIREDASAAYSAGAYGYAQTIGDKTLVNIVGSCPMKPEKKDLALKIMREEVKTLASKVNAEDLAKTQKNMVKDFETKTKENSFWTSVLTLYYSKGIDIYTGYADIVNAMTPAKVAAFVKKVTSQGNDVEVIMLPADAKK